MTCFDSPLSCSSSSGIHGKLTHHALFKMLLLPAGYVSLQGQNLLLSLPQLLMQRWDVKVRVWSSTCLLGLRLPLKKKIKVYLSRSKYDFLISLVHNRLSLLIFFTCCALRLLSSCSSLVLNLNSSASLFSHAACNCARALCILSTFST